MNILAGWDFGRVGTFSMRVTETTGPYAFSIVCNEDGVNHGDSVGASLVNVSDDTSWCHEDLSVAVRSDGTTFGEYDDFAGILKTALDAGSLAGPNNRVYTVTWNRANQTYTISVAGDTVAINFSVIDAAAGARMRLALGYASNLGASASHVSTVRPYYSVVPKASSLSRVTRPHETRGFIRGMVTSSGHHYVVQPRQLAEFCEATVMFEYLPSGAPSIPGTAVYIQDANGLVPWTWKHFFNHVGGIEPFRLDDGTHDWVVTLEKDSAHFEPEKTGKDDWLMWHIPLRMHYEASL